MRLAFFVATALGALALTPAMAQPDQHPGNNAHSSAHPEHGGGPGHVAPVHTEHRPAPSAAHRHTTYVVTEHRHATVYRTHIHHVSTSHHVVASHHASATRNVHPVAVRHADVRALRRNFAAPRRFHHGAYLRPSGWYAHRWVYGERLPVGWYAHNYWIVDFSLFGLVYPPDGLQWIRVGDDALLVDTDTGEIIRVEYGVFY